MSLSLVGRGVGGLFKGNMQIAVISAAGSTRGISTTSPAQGKRNLRKFHLGNKRGTKQFKEERNAGAFEDIPVESEVRPVGFTYGDVHHVVPEMVPQFVVPDLTDCKLKPYVSYRATDVYQDPFTAEDLFVHVYLRKMEEDFKEGKLDEKGRPLQPSPEEAMTPDEAWLLARKTGSDLFAERIPKQWECLDINLFEMKEKRKEEFGYSHFSDFMKEPYDPVEETKEETEKKPKIVPTVRHRSFF